MIIDIHSHFYPEDITKNLLENFYKKTGYAYYGNGTIKSLKEYMKKNNINISINLPVATNPEKIISINRKMIEINLKEKNIICFGAMHPDFGNKNDIEKEILFLKNNNIKGIKLHPEYQNFYPDDGKLFTIYEFCIKYDLVILFHSGYDIMFDEENVHSSPKRFLNLKEKFPGLKIILAHMGGFKMWDNVYKLLAGKDFYFDTSFSLELSDESMKSIIYEHGIDRVLFGSDFPWCEPAKIIDKLKNCIDSKEDLEKIFYKNAKTLLNLMDS